MLAGVLDNIVHWLPYAINAIMNCAVLSSTHKRAQAHYAISLIIYYIAAPPLAV